MKTPSVNAFTINRLYPDSFFPFSVEVSQKGAFSKMSICPQRVLDLCDLIDKHALDNLVVFDVNVSRIGREFARGVIPIEGLAARSNILYYAIDSQTIVLPKAKLYPLLSTFEHFDLSLFDIGGDWNEIQAIGQVLTCRDHNWAGHEGLLPKLPSSAFFLNAHDDCYLTIEAQHPDVSRDIFSKTLQIYAGTILAQENNAPAEIPDVPQDLLDSFWKDSFGLAILREATEIKDGYLGIGVCKPAFSFRTETEYSLEGWIVYNLQNQEWLVET